MTAITDVAALRPRGTSGEPFHRSRELPATHWALSLRIRLLALISVLIFAFSLAGGAYIIERARKDIVHEVQSATELAERFIDARIAASSLEARVGNPATGELDLRALRTLRHVTVLYYDASGRLIESSMGPVDDDDTSAPEWFQRVVQASLPRFDDYRRTIERTGGTTGTVVVRADPIYETAEIWNVARGLLELLALFVLMTNGLVAWAVGRALVPIRAVQKALIALGQGELGIRLQSADVAELAGLHRDFNRMAEELERRTDENRNLNRKLIVSQEQERQRLARELHDEIGQCITAIHADALAIQRTDDSECNASVREGAGAIVIAVARIKEMVRSILQRLHPTVIERLGFVDAIERLVDQMRALDTRCTFELTLGRGCDELPGDLCMTLYRLTQEALTNVVRHADARIVRISIDLVDERRVRLFVEDDGRGFASSSTDGKYGLAGMSDRVAAHDGTLAIESQPQRGTRIVAVLSREVPAE
jgi:two-component system, NarL family, sensor histidine kinase UhpB